VLREPPAPPLRPTVMPPAREAVRVDYRVPERRAASLERLDLRLESRLRDIGTVELSGLERTR
jgi:hypothetical protein